jgi:hypothetical protein
MLRSLRWVAVGPSLALALALVSAAGCGTGNSPVGASADASLPLADAGGTYDGPTFGGGDASANVLAIAPANPTAGVTITDRVVATKPVALQAIASGGGSSTPVSAAWTFDRGELGSIDGHTGVFTASGHLGGTGTVTATWNGLVATTKLTVAIVSTENGNPAGGDAGTDDGGLGGIGGVGGSGLGGPVPPSTQGLLTGTPAKPASPTELGWLYPYDQTVWPRGILAPLLQWGTTHTASAVYIHLTEQNFEFKGFYSGTALVNQPIDALAWQQATYGNGGDKLHVELTITDGMAAWGPIAEDWIIAPGVLQGTVYYGAYNSQVAGAGSGATLAIQPGATSPTLAIAGTGTTCNVCHEVSADGSTLILQHTTTQGNYPTGSAYDLTDGGSVIANYGGPAADGTTNDFKFVWSALYPDGTFAMANSQYARVSYQGNSALFRRADGTTIPTTGWSGVVASAVTPSFSPDGRKLAFNYWTGTDAGAVQPGAGHNLVVMDFNCGAPDGGVGCSGAPPYSFSNLRQVYDDTAGARYPGWPAFLPDGTGLVFHNALLPGYFLPWCPSDGSGDCALTTWYGGQADLWWSNLPANGSPAPSPVRLDALDGLSNGVSYLPTSTLHPNDTILNYEPTVNPIATGGYYWVVFTSRRMYGSVETGDPFLGPDGTDLTVSPCKKLWVAALDVNGTPGKDISHPAFYLPGQELDAGNNRGFWVVNPCKPDGRSCLAGDDCCSGFCRAGDAGALICTSQPPGCSNEYEDCSSNADCCGASQGFRCIGGRCASPPTQ